MRTSERVTLHFDLSGHPADAEFTLHGGGEKHVLTAYADAPGKLAEHRAANAALGLIPDSEIGRITHFAQDAELMADHPSVRSVVYPSLDEHALGELALVFVHVPSADHARYVRTRPADDGPAAHLSLLCDYGVAPESIDIERSEQVRLAAAAIKTPRESAKALVFHHPEIGSTNPLIAQAVLDHYITQAPSFSGLVGWIMAHPPTTTTSWYRKDYATWCNPDTNLQEPCPANLDLTFKDGTVPDWPEITMPPGTSNAGAQIKAIPQYVLTDEEQFSDGGVMAGVRAVVHEVLRATKDDVAFNGHLWSSQPGTTQRVRTDVAHNVAATERQAAAGGPAATGVTSEHAKGFAIKNTTSSYGLWLYDDELTFDSKTLSFPVKNWPSRWLTVYVEFRDQAGDPIKRIDIPGWFDQMAEWGLEREFEPSDTKNYLTYLGAGNAIFGVPVPPLTQRVDIAFPWPDAASTAHVLFGGLGAAREFSDWDTDVCVGGVVGTGILCYGIAALSLTFSVFIVNPWLAKRSDIEMVGVMAVGIVVGVFGFAIGAAEHDNSFGKTLLSKLSNTVASIIFGKVVERIAVAAAKQYLAKTIAATVADVTAQEALEQVPFAGWAAKVAAVAADLAALAATTVECVRSPSVYDLEVTRTMDLTVVVKPDPAHGTKDHDPDWPLVADNWAIQVSYPTSYSAGTSITMRGLMPATVGGDPLEVKFPGIPAGGKIDIVAGVYSKDNWLAGTWESGLLSAVPDADDQLSASGAITERLVPLTATTSYSRTRRLAYDPVRGHVWQQIDATSVADDAPRAAATVDDCAEDGNRVCRRQNITYSNNAYMIGYAWQASGQHLPRDFGAQADDGQLNAFQAISALGEPQDRIIEPSRGFTHPSFIAFEQFRRLPFDTVTDVPPGTVATIRNELDAGGAVGPTLRKWLVERGYATESTMSDITVGVVVANWEWTLGEAGKDPVFDLQIAEVVLGNGGGEVQTVISVYAWPVPSQDNFYLDSRDFADNKHYVRGLSFESGSSTFDYATGSAWGQFIGVTIDDLAVHPAGYIVGVDYENHKLLALQLAAAPEDADKAPVAMPLSGEGVREGLLKNPVALTVTADGRILVLEAANERIQAFDVQGNPVPCFAAGQSGFGLDGALVAALDARDGGDALVQALQRSVEPATAALFDGGASGAPASIAALDSATVDGALSGAFVKSGYVRSGDGEQTPTFTVAVTTAGGAWLVTDVASNLQFDVRHTTDDTDGLCVYRAFEPSIDVTSRGSRWLITDTAHGMTFSVENRSHDQSTPNLRAMRLVSTMALRTAGGAGVSYLDVAVEATGYIYCLTATGADQNVIRTLDVYTPDGTPLFHQDAPQAARLTVDLWRSMFTVDYDVILGPGNRTEPGVSTWAPSTPPA